MDQSISVCDVDDIKPGTKKRIEVSGRDIFLVNVKGTIYALDSFCYHAGGPLYKGDIEDIAGWTCMVCPWHKYKICVDTGKNLEEVIDFTDDTKPPEWKLCSVKQRTHKVTVKDGQVLVTFSDTADSLSSDYFNSEEYRKKNSK